MSAAKNLKEEFAHLLTPEHLMGVTKGLRCGIPEIDSSLGSSLCPKGELSLFYGCAGSGKTSFLLHCLRQLAQQESQSKVAWFQGDSQLTPFNFSAYQIDSKNIFVIQKKPSSSHLENLWALAEVLQSQLFALVVFDTDAELLKPQKGMQKQLEKLRLLARRYSVSLVFITEGAILPSQSFLFSFIAQTSQSQLIIERALHRPVPLKFSRRLFNAFDLPQISYTTALIKG